ncbi:MAG: RNA polymerase I-associated factor PAF67-domain-containing protein [Monoraphidium minutum]|nr:MAG: RNA polymerase I-associated factor PAF67-domain-containing protein [Monoraphidium minutum]
MADGPFDSGFVPDIVKQFVHYLYRHIRERNIPEIQSMYEISYPKLSERYFKNGPWPHVDLVSDLVDQDHVFCLLYKEMYFRHLFAKTQPGLRARCESWDNYCELFGVILHGNVNMQLPVPWLWDMVDEFLYQFQSFCQYRSKLAHKSAEEIELLRQCDKVWALLDVLNVLQALVDKSGTVAAIEADGGAALLASGGYPAGASNVLPLLGYFSLLGQLRVHALIGDYATGLSALYPLNLFERRSLFTAQLPPAHIALFYYASFAYLMLRRYSDAARCLNAILAYVSRVKAFHTRNAAYEQMLKKNEQMYALLACAVALCPAVQKGLDEGVLAQLREKYADKLARMARGDESPFEELFSYGCPKFVSPAPPSYDNPQATNVQEAFRQQLGAFLREVRACAGLPLLKQYLLLYSSISVPKLSSLLDMEEGALRQALMALKNKNYVMAWEPAAGADMTGGSFVSVADIDFYVDADPTTGTELVIVSDAVAARQQIEAEVLSRHIFKLQQVTRELSAQPIVTTATAAAAATPAY